MGDAVGGQGEPGWVASPLLGTTKSCVRLDDAHVCISGLKWREVRDSSAWIFPRKTSMRRSTTSTASWLTQVFCTRGEDTCMDRARSGANKTLLPTRSLMLHHNARKSLEILPRLRACRHSRRVPAAIGLCRECRLQGLLGLHLLLSLVSQEAAAEVALGPRAFA